MKKSSNAKRINLYVPIYLLEEIDELAKDDNKTRTEIFVKGAERELEHKKRQKKLDKFLARKTPILDPKKYKEIYKLGGTEWVKRLRQEGEK